MDNIICECNIRKKYHTRNCKLISLNHGRNISLSYKTSYFNSGMNNEYNDGFSIDDNKPLPNIILNIIIKIFETIELINVNGSDGLISLDELIEYIKNNNELLDINDESCNNLNFKYIKQDIKILIEEINNKNKEYEEIKSKNKELEIKNNFLCEEIEKYKKIEIELKNKINKINNNEKNNKLKLEDITELCTMLEN